MNDDLNQEILKTTQTLLSKYIKKPPLTDKLLKKPPFRYLHDIVTSIINETGFLKGLYTQEEMIADNSINKAAKVAFLDKLIAAVKLTTGADLTVKSSKVISGLEVAKTHELLQAIGRALENKVDSKNAVEEILNKGVRKSGKDSSKSKIKEDSSKRKPSNDRKKQGDIVKSPSPRSLKEPADTNAELSPSSSAKENIQNNEQVTTKHKEEIEKHQKAEQEDTSTILENSTKRKEDSLKDTEELVQEKAANANEVQTKSSEQKQASNLEEKSPQEVQQKSSPRGDKKSSPRGDKISSPREQKSSKADDTTPREEKKTPPDKIKPSRERNKNSPSSETRKSDTTSNENSKAAVKSPKHEKTATIKDKRDERSAKERGEKESPRKDRTNDKSANSASKKDSRPSSARPGSRKPLKATAPGPAVTSNAAPASGVAKPPSARPARPGSALKRPPSAGPRPPSARPGAPRVKDRGEIIGEEPVSVLGPVNLIRETGRGEEEEEMVTVESVEIENQRKQSLPSAEDQENQGQLVSQILETQKEFEDGLEPDVLRRTQIEWEGARKKGREAMARDIEKLKENIQTITRSALPLGKLMNFYQEDVEEIERELSTWKTRSEELRKQLDVEMEKTTESIEPLKLQLEELESKIVEESEQVSLMKMKIHRNDQRIHLLLKSSRGLSGR